LRQFCGEPAFVRVGDDGPPEPDDMNHAGEASPMMQPDAAGEGSRAVLRLPAPAPFGVLTRAGREGVENEIGSGGANTK
jgi:hypothetical protein